MQAPASGGVQARSRQGRHRLQLSLHCRLSQATCQLHQPPGKGSRGWSLPVTNHSQTGLTCPWPPHRTLSSHRQKASASIPHAMCPWPLHPPVNSWPLHWTLSSHRDTASPPRAPSSDSLHAHRIAWPVHPARPRPLLSRRLLHTFCNHCHFGLTPHWQVQ